jgi:WD40 repeat protein
MGRDAICQDDSGTYLLKLMSGESVPIEMPDSAEWRLASLDTLYVEQPTDDDRVKYYLLRYISNGFGSPIQLAPLDITWLLLPKLSSDGAHLIGAGGIYPTDQLAEVDLQNGTSRPLDVGISRNIFDLAWSPSDPILAVGSSDVAPVDIARCQTNVFSTYDASTGHVEVISRLQAGQCYDYFDTYTRNIWSPDGTKVVLMVDSSMCVFTIRGGEGNCMEFGQLGGDVVRVTWSPDSQRLAYVTNGEKLSLHVISADGSDHSILIRGINERPWLSDLVWAAP